MSLKKVSGEIVKCISRLNFRRNYGYRNASNFNPRFSTPSLSPSPNSHALVKCPKPFQLFAASISSCADTVVNNRNDQDPEEAFGVDYAEGGLEDPHVYMRPTSYGDFIYVIHGLHPPEVPTTSWADVLNNKVPKFEIGDMIWPKPVYGRPKVVAKKMVLLHEGDDPSPLLAEWRELLQPSRVDWTYFLDRLKRYNTPIYLKVVELALDEESFEANVGDYSNLIDVHAKSGCLQAFERILMKMNQKGIQPDVLTLTTIFDMYKEAGELSRAKETFETLQSQGFQLDTELVKNELDPSFVAFLNDCFGRMEVVGKTEAMSEKIAER